MNGSLPISVVIPAYEAQDRIAEALASVVAQSRGPREIIVVDDGSADRTADIARSLGASVIVQANAGCSAARNAGIAHATQPWIALLDADDTWLPQKLELQWEALQATRAGLCATDFQYVHPSGERSAGAIGTNRGYRRVDERTVLPGVAELSRETVARAIPTGMFLLPSALLFERKIATEDGVWFAERALLRSNRYYYLAEDAEWCLRALRVTDVVVVKRVLVEYRVSPGSLSSNAGRMRFGDAKLGELICATPARYAPACVPEWARLRPARLREATLQFMRQLQFDVASVVAREAFAQRRRPLEAALLAFALAMDRAPARAVATAARSAWRRSLKRIALHLPVAR